MEFRKGQKEFIENYLNGYAAIPAIPGGGKTFTLSMWVAKKIIDFHNDAANEINNFNKILIVTYMNSAANSFKQRITNILKENGIQSTDKFECSTIHSLCLQIVMDSAKENGMDEEFAIIDEFEKSELIKSITEQFFEYNKQQFKYLLKDEQDEEGEKELRLELAKNAPQILSRLKNSDKAIDIDDFLVKFYMMVLGEYTFQLKKRGYVDFDDMIKLAYEYLSENDAIRGKYQKTYTFVCEDEAQDSNDLQCKVLDILSNGNLIRVGDANQSINGSFTSASQKSFNDFCNNSDVAKFNITQSTRNTKQIISLANKFLDSIIYTHPNVKIRSALVPQYIETVDKGKITNPNVDYLGLATYLHEDEICQNEYIISRLINQIKSGQKLTTAVLFSRNKEVNDFALLCEKNGINYEILGSPSKESQFVIRAIGSVLKYKFETLTGAEKEMFDELLKANNYNPNEILENSKQISVYPEIDCILEIAKLFELNEMQMSIVNFMVNKLMLMYFSGKINCLETIAHELLQNQNAFIKYACSLNEFDGYIPNDEIVTLTTYHKSKGLEWDSVYLAGIVDFNFPYYINDYFGGFNKLFKWNYQNIYAYVISVLNGIKLEDAIVEYKNEIICEKIRLMYVAITRAKKILVLNSYENKYKNAKLTLFRQLRELIKNIKEEYDEK